MVVIGFACLPQQSQPTLQAQTSIPTPTPLPGLPANPVGYVAVMRHAIAPGTGDPGNFRLGDCQTQRNLSETGRQQARRLGQLLRDRQVPVTRVLSSQWCRCLETARLLDLGQVEPFPILTAILILKHLY
ncbi:MAG TPA: histidine phosphatase family protein [Leptolyngbyaceae cyanobacterium M33_DOE_097]|uniref:Histidine phosphatase family protein n=1 Tax=Oscillatoriales cyanobacterium SpSt-418 TaxID=2282169 RepID=A0A7C3KCA0_9CYAN|nr:histidine phosphatase family protein [Leptolyngbyaceae cyanobacterium M33_DOE_097]